MNEVQQHLPAVLTGLKINQRNIISTFLTLDLPFIPQVLISSVLKIGRGNRDNLEIISHISPLKHFVTIH